MSSSSVLLSHDGHSHGAGTTKKTPRTGRCVLVVTDWQLLSTASSDDERDPPSSNNRLPRRPRRHSKRMRGTTRPQHALQPAAAVSESPSVLPSLLSSAAAASSSSSPASSTSSDLLSTLTDVLVTWVREHCPPAHRTLRPPSLASSPPPPPETPSQLPPLLPHRRRPTLRDQKRHLYRRCPAHHPVGSNEKAHRFSTRLAEATTTATTTTITTKSKEGHRHHPFSASPSLLLSELYTKKQQQQQQQHRQHHQHQYQPPQQTLIECRRRAIDHNDVEAQFDLGWMYDHGFRVPQDRRRAVHWYLAAAQAGHALAQYRLAELYEEEEEEEKEEQAQEQQEDEGAREQGDKEKQQEGIHKTEEKSLQYDKTKIEEEQGVSNRGDGPTRATGDSRLLKAKFQSQAFASPLVSCSSPPLPRVLSAHEWYVRAAKQGLADAQFRVGAMYDTQPPVSEGQRRQLLSQSPPPPPPPALHHHECEPVLSVSREASKVPLTTMATWTMDHFNNSTNNDHDRKAVKWYRRAATQGHVEAQFRLGSMYAAGRGVFRETGEAYRWLLRAAEQGHSRAQTRVGWMLQEGQATSERARTRRRYGHRQDASQEDRDEDEDDNDNEDDDVEDEDVQAEAWYRRAAKQGEGEAWFRLGWLYKQGRGGLVQDDCRAMACFVRASERGFAPATRQVQRWRRKGRGVHQLPVVGPDWVRAVPNYLLGCVVTCQRVVRLMMQSDEDACSPSLSSE